jgi:dTDP-glucose pyrophosphorylase
VDLVVLAAGIGSRFGGDKQLEAVGPAGETLVDYTLFDAARAGFARAVLVVRPELDAGLRRHAVARYGGRIAVRTVHQTLDAPALGVALPCARRRPWGTAHAVLAAEPAVEGAFAVVNSDDFYGAEAFEAAARFLRDSVATRSASAALPPTWALAAYRLAGTLSDAGSVNRALCRLDRAGWLLDLEERAYDRVAAEREPDALVSMNFWCFDQAVFGLLRRGLADFAAQADLERDEYRLPDAVRAWLGEGEARVRVLHDGGRWFGLTHAQDREVVRAELRRLVAEGSYPASLWSG